jgi:hypothetical protein
VAKLNKKWFNVSASHVITIFKIYFNVYYDDVTTKNTLFSHGQNRGEKGYRPWLIKFTTLTLRVAYWGVAKFSHG